MRRLTICAITFITALICFANHSTMQSPCSLGTPYRACRACGNAETGTVIKTRSVKAQQENVLKNRDASPTTFKVVKVEDLRNPARNYSFFPDMSVEVTAYVARVVQGGVRETCNCKRIDLRDVVIEVVASPDEATDLAKHVILEISPRWERKLGLNDADYNSMLSQFKNAIEGKWVTFRGWLFYDSVHVDGSESTNPKNFGNWRATPWEVHPVTYYKVLPRRP